MLQAGKTTLVVLILARIVAFAQTAELQGAQLALQVSNELEVRLFERPHWEQDCLALEIARSNRTNETLWLPNMGLYIDMRVTDSTTGTEWVNVYGLTDIIDYTAEPLGPGKTRHDPICLPATIAVVDQGKKTRRQLKVSGELQIEALFFVSEQDYLNSRKQREKTFNMSETQRKEMTVPYPQRNLLLIKAPCHEQEPSCACGMPPLLLHGEGRVIPDIYEFHPDWNERGDRVNKKLAQQPQCPSGKPLSLK